MANDITVQTDPAHGQPALALLAKNPSAWTIDAARALVGDEPAAVILAAIDRVKYEMLPVPAAPDAKASWEAAMDERLRRIGVKIAPLAPVDQITEWRKALVEALGNLPSLIALTAARRAIHTPMKFLNEVEQVVRDIAADLIDRRRLALARLAALREDLARAVTPKLTDHIVEPISIEEVRRMPPYLREMGARHGWIPADMLAIVEAEHGAMPAGDHVAVQHEAAKQIGDMLERIDRAA